MLENLGFAPRVAVVLLVAAIVGVASPNSAAEAPRPTIKIATVPPRDAGGEARMARIDGAVSDAPSGARVVLFAHGDVWYVQPYVASPYTEIRDGKWANDTHLGTEYAALLVASSYKPPSTTGVLPEVRDGVLAITVVPGKP
jgi:hypothetical protein